MESVIDQLSRLKAKGGCDFEFQSGQLISDILGGSNGGNGSVDATVEHWGDPGRLLDTLTDNNQEFCTQYNIIMVSRYLFTWSAHPKYADHYERAYYNGILGDQYPNAPGVMVRSYGVLW